MKFCILIIINLLFVKCFSQEVNINYYILGAQNNYSGWIICKGENKKISQFYYSDICVLYKIDSLLQIANTLNSDKIEYQIIFKKDSIRVGPSYYSFESEKLFKFLKKKYRYSNYGRNDENVKFYSGRLIYRKFKNLNNDEIYSFLLGAFGIYGTKTFDKTYKYTFYNTSSKAEVIYNLLFKINCEEIKIEENKGPRSSSWTVYFMPSDKFKVMLHKEIKLRDKFDVRYSKFSQIALGL